MSEVPLYRGWSLGFRVEGPGFRFSGLGFRASGFRFKISVGSGFWVSDEF